MRLFALQGSHELGQAVASAAGTELDPLEEREFEGGEHKARPLVSVRNEDVYILHSLAGGGRSPAERLVRLLFFIGCCRDNGAARVTAVVPYLAYLRKDQQTKATGQQPPVAQLLEWHRRRRHARAVNKSAFQAVRRSVTLDTRAVRRTIAELPATALPS